ncbi:MAG TPA: ABC transporter permease [Candidatus Melainabacteria bacterium]|jgi:spermidine/putrescine transport system permease protein|nr:ABC transporter permease [Candidatus Melainabacteria bacterium]HIN64196.1 ABC transporter permease [Candidatus Obscuribacterales bacterium]
MLAKPFWLHLYAFGIYAFMYIPILVLVTFSFEQSRLAVRFTGFTLDWYIKLFHNEEIGLALANSLIVAVLAVLFSTIMGTMAAVGLTRLHFKGKGAYRGLLLLPIIIPEIAMAVAALILFIAIGVPLGLATVVVSHIVFCVAYVTLTVMGRMEGLDPRLEEAAQDLGASPVMAFFRVTLPLLAPGIVAGALLAFVLSLDDFVITQFTAGVGSTTLPLRIFSMVKFGVSPEINALSTLMILVTGGAALIAETVRHRKA